MYLAKSRISITLHILFGRIVGVPITVVVAVLLCVPARPLRLRSRIPHGACRPRAPPSTRYGLSYKTAPHAENSGESYISRKSGRMAKTATNGLPRSTSVDIDDLQLLIPRKTMGNGQGDYGKRTGLQTDKWQTDRIMCVTIGNILWGRTAMYGYVE